MIHLPKIEDFLGRAAEAKHAAYAAERVGDFDAAWRLHHERRELYLKHAQRQGFTKTQTLAIDATVAEDLANVLRKEGRHLDAFAYILYWATAQRDHPIKRHETKLRAYLKRSELTHINLDEVMAFVRESPRADFQTVRAMVAQWADERA